MSSPAARIPAFPVFKKPRPPARSTITRDAVEGLVTLASRAPSVHNTQPWQFRYADESVELRVDPARRLRVADPAGRELVISCGAALRNLELAVRGLGLKPLVRLLPDRNDRHLLATVRGRPGPPPSALESRLLSAIMRRHSHRGRFAATAPPPVLLGELRQAATANGARLAIVEEGPCAELIVELAWSADAEQRADSGVAAEALSWATRPDVDRRDGVPPRAYPRQPTARTAGALPGRDFAPGQRWGKGELADPGGSVLAVLLTDGDRPADWLRAGRALQEVLLRAAAEWVFGSFATQPLELAQVRAALGVGCRLPGFPQMLFRLGCVSVTAQTPRRPIGDVLTIE